MNNAAGTNPLSLSVFGGAVTEMAPSDLPEGASPFSQDMDFVPGAVFTRGGRANQMSYGNLFNENLGTVGSSVAIGAPAVWSNPTNAGKNIPGTYASATVNQPVAGYIAPAFRFAFSADAVSMTTLNIVQTQNPLPGSTLVVILSSTHFDPAQPNPIFTSVTDTRGNLYSLIYSQDVSPIGQNMKTSVFIAKSNNVGGGNTVTAHTTNITTTFLMGTVMEYTASNAFTLEAASFQANASGGGGSNFVASAPITTTGGVDLLLGIVQYGSTAVPPPLGADPGFTIRSQFSESGTIGWALGVTDRFAMAPGTYTDNVFTNTTNAFALITLAFQLIPTPSPTSTQVLNVSQFGFNIPLGQRILGLEIEVLGNQSTQLADAIISGSAANGPISISAQLPAADGVAAIIGTPTASYGVAITPAMLNNPNFSVQIVASASGGELVTFNIYAVKVKVFLSPFPPSNVNWLKTYEQTSGQTDTLVLDGNGILWDESVNTALGVLNSIYTAINPGSFAKSVTFENTEYIAFSNLLQGTDMPRQWNGTNLDRVSQVGPAAPPSFASTSTGSTIASIRQNSPFLLIPNVTNPNAYLGVGTGPGINPNTPGNVMTIFLQSTDIPPAYFVVGSNIQLSGFPTLNGNVVNNDPTGVTNPAYYTVTAIQQQIPGESARDWISFQVPFSTFITMRTPAGCNIQATAATLTATAQVPFLEVGNQFTLTGVSPAGWNNTFRVTATPNASVLQIVNTSLTGNIAQYVFNLISGSNPVVGQFVNINGTLNGGGIFNVVKGVITSASLTSFSLSIQSPNITGAAEANASGVIYGTVFLFDPAVTVTNPIIGNAGAGGLIGTSGVVGIGVRRAVVMWKTRNGWISPPSPYVEFNVTGSASAIVAGSIPIGPPNVIARIIAFTGAGGANYFWVPQPVTVVSNGQKIIYPATIINDNVTTQVTLSIPDAVLLSSTAIDIQGNNLFAQIELGSSRGFLTYASRLVAWGEQNKVQNFLNLSFDGGIGVQTLQQLAVQPTVPSYPLGWTVNSGITGAGGQLVTSPLFGNSYYVKNSTGGVQAFYGLLFQSAFANQLGTPIINASTLYSCRVVARCPSGAASGTLRVDLYSPVFSTIYGAFNIPLASMTSNYQIFTGLLLAQTFGVVPPDLQLRIYVQNMPNNGDVEIDRIEPFPTLAPSFSTQFHMSYANNQEAFDLVTGFSGPAQNQQKCNGGMVLFDLLYMFKERSMYSTSDNGVTEPYQWNWKTVSDKVGTIGQNSYDYGEGWAVTACRPGLYFFEGGEPLKLSQEIQSVWDLINWAAGHTIWVRNDSTTKSIKIGVPIPTPNKFMPEFPVNANPTVPNVVLSMSYRELNTGQELARTGPIRSSYSGRLLSPEPARKWSFWNIACPYGDFIDRGDNTSPLFYGSGYVDNKVFALVDSQLHDDGLPINSFYITHGFAKTEIAEGHGIGPLRAQMNYMTANVSGSGVLNTYIYPEDPRNQLPFTLDSTPLDAISQGDNELAVGGVTGQRFFIRMGTNSVGAAFSLSGITVAMTKDPWAEIRGTSRGMTQ